MSLLMIGFKRMDIGFGLELDGWNLGIGWTNYFSPQSSMVFIIELYEDEIVVLRVDLARVCNSFILQTLLQPRVRWATCALLRRAITLDSSKNIQSCLEGYSNLQPPSLKRNSLVQMHALAKGKNLGPNSFTANFFKIYQSFLSTDFMIVVDESLARGRFSNDITRGLIVLLFKGGDRLRLTNWRPITLLNTTYKIFIKALQRQR